MFIMYTYVFTFHINIKTDTIKWAIIKDII